MALDAPRWLLFFASAVLVACGGSSATGGGGAASTASGNGDGVSTSSGQGAHDATSSSTSMANGGGTSSGGGGPGIASKYPGDTGIDQDPAVVWAENFEEGSVDAVTARYDSFQDPAGMQLVTDVAPGSAGHASIKWTSSGSGANATDLYKKLPNHDELWVRWYAKYQAGVSWHHAGMWFGGYDPPIPYPNPQAGLKPNGDDRFAIAIEPAFNIGAANPRLDFYNYWMTMHSWMAMPMGNTAYYGNSLVHQNAFTVDEDQWMCLEVHAKMNTDLGSSSGAVLEVWKNDMLVQHFDGTAAVGYWIRDKFCPTGADGTECTDYPPPQGTQMIPLDQQWRSTAGLTLNYFWPQNYITDDPGGDLQLDDMVVATARIGCIQP
jgi:hypothetical protein